MIMYLLASLITGMALASGSIGMALNGFQEWQAWAALALGSIIIIATMFRLLRSV
jgi:hypothetical protein